MVEKSKKIKYKTRQNKKGKQRKGWKATNIERRESKRTKKDKGKCRINNGREKDKHK